MFAQPNNARCPRCGQSVAPGQICACTSAPTIITTYVQAQPRDFEWWVKYVWAVGLTILFAGLFSRTITRPEWLPTTFDVISWALPALQIICAAVVSASSIAIYRLTKRAQGRGLVAASVIILASMSAYTVYMRSFEKPPKPWAQQMEERHGDRTAEPQKPKDQPLQVIDANSFFRFLSIGDDVSRVETLFGNPDGRMTREGWLVYTYQVGMNIDLWIDRNQKVRAIQAVDGGRVIRDVR